MFHLSARRSGPGVAPLSLLIRSFTHVPFIRSALRPRGCAPLAADTQLHPMFRFSARRSGPGAAPLSLLIRSFTHVRHTAFISVTSRGSILTGCNLREIFCTAPAR
jgi:hypothetical protein